MILPNQLLLFFLLVGIPANIFLVMHSNHIGQKKPMRGIIGTFLGTFFIYTGLSTELFLFIPFGVILLSLSARIIFIGKPLRVRNFDSTR